MVIKNLTKKVIVSTAFAGALFVLPHMGTHNAAHAATPTISTTQQLLQVGSQGASVRSVQSRLKELGYYNYTIDGDYGPITKAAVMKFQSASHIGVDGIAGPVTLGKLFGSNPSSSKSSTSSVSSENSAPASTTRTISAAPSTSTSQISSVNKSNTSEVKVLQTDLQNLGYYHDVIDGLYGPNTTAAVMNFQRANHLSVDGIAGPNTMGALQGSNPVAASTAPAAPTGTTASSSSSASVSNIIADAEKLQGVPYQWAGTTPSGFDCSGFTDYVFAENGITLPRTAAEQYAQGTPSSLVPGALVFFQTYTSGASHVGIYIGNNEFISSTSSSGVSISSMDNPYWKPRYLGARTY